MIKVILSVVLVLIFTISPVLSAELKPPQTYVLCYHTFLAKKQFPTDFSIAEFRQQIAEMQSRGIRFVSLADVVKGQKYDCPTAVIFIDDGNISAYQAYQSVLKPLGIKPVFAIYPNVISHVRFAMTWDQLQEVLREGCEVAAHGYYHLYLTDKFYREDPTGFDREIRVSKQILETHLGVPITTFVYPFGLVSESAKTAIREAGYTQAFSLNQAPLDLETQDPYQLPRYMITRPNPPRTLRFK